MNGRGRGISNAPAWMTRGGAGGNLPPHQAGDNLGRNGPPPPPRNSDGGGGGGGGGGYPPYHDAFGRLSREAPPSRRGGPPPYDHRRYDDRGGGGGGRDHRHPHRGPPPPSDQWEGRGRGGGDAPPRRGSGGHGPRAGRGGGGGGLGGDDDEFGDEGGGDRRESQHRNKSSSSSAITFRSYDEERDWVEDRRRKRKARPGKFDVPPTPAQLAVDAAVSALANPAATDFAGIPAGRDFAAVPQQTRHARRLYIGHLPPNLTEEELHIFFRDAIRQALVTKPADGDDDPILSVYINHERRFCFLEFRTVEMATACLALDGLDIHGKGKVKVKRPNDYNPTMAPKVHPSAIPELDVSKLGIISGTVQDGPNKVFIGGLHYHLTENQVLELLQAFGKVKSFHLVKNEPDSLTSKGYCFVEYSDPNVTQVAVMGLNGMDLGGGKVLTARVAGDRSGAMPGMAAVPMLQTTAAAMNTGAMYNGAAPAPPPPGIKPDAVIVSGYDIETLVDAAMGLRPMPTAPMHLDQFGLPITRVSTVIPLPALPIPVIQQPQVAPISTGMMGGAAPVPTALPPGASALDIANAALDAAFGQGASFALPQMTTVGVGIPPISAPVAPKTRVLVLHNMVSDDDLKTDDDYDGLKEEVEEEVRKFGKLLGIKIPRTPSALVDASAIRKIFLEYATVQDAANAERELAGRQFGPNTVHATFHDEKEFAAGRLY